MSHHENDKVNDRVESKPNNGGLDNVDRMALMQEKPQGQPDTGSFKLHDMQIQGMDKSGANGQGGDSPAAVAKKDGTPEQKAEQLAGPKAEQQNPNQQEKPADKPEQKPEAQDQTEGRDNQSDDDLTRSVKGKKAGHAAPKAEDKKDGPKAGDAASGKVDGTAGDAQPPKKEEPKQEDRAHDPEIVKQTGDNPKAPTVAFADVFNVKDQYLANNTTVSHGEISRKAAENNGFNTVALDLDNTRDKFGNKDFSKDLNAIDKKIDNGELKLGKGDALNISMGNEDPTFKQASDFVGFPVTRENLAENREKILNRMNEIKEDPSRSESDRATANRVVETNKAIDKLQGKGVEVIHAAGNEGNDKFSWEFMNAKTQLSSNKPDGTADSFSADHSLTTKGNGVIPVHSKMDVDLLSKTPVAKQTGSYEVGDTGVKFQREKLPPLSGDSHVFNRQNDDYLAKATKARPDVSQPSSMLAKETAMHGTKVPEAKQFSAEPQRERNPDKFTKQPEAIAQMWTAKIGKPGVVGGDSAVPKAGETTSSEVLRGTSFSNIEYLKGNFDSMARKKNSW